MNIPEQVSDEWLANEINRITFRAMDGTRRAIPSWEETASALIELEQRRASVRVDATAPTEPKPGAP